MKPLIVWVLAIICFAPLAHGQKKDKDDQDVNFQTEHFVTIVLREKINGNEILTIEKQEEKLIAVLKASEFDPLGLQTLLTQEKLVVISEKVTITLKEKYLLIKAVTAEELGKLCETLAMLDVHEIFVSKNKTAKADGGSGTTTTGNATPALNPNQSILVANQQPVNTTGEVARIISRVLDVSFLVLSQRR